MFQQCNVLQNKICGQVEEVESRVHPFNPLETALQGARECLDQPPTTSRALLQLQLLQGPKENRGCSQAELVSPFLQGYLQSRDAFPPLASPFD